jgi:hypothetical protein
MTAHRSESIPQPLTRCAYCYNLVGDTVAEEHTTRTHRTAQAEADLPVFIIPDKPTQCPHCKRNVSELTSIRAHIRTCFANTTRPARSCPYCPISFKTAFNLKLHIRRVHSGRIVERQPPMFDSDRKTKAFLDHSFPSNKLYVLNKSNTIVSKSLQASTQAHTITFTPEGKHIAGVGLVAQLLERIATDLMSRNTKWATASLATQSRRKTRVTQHKTYQLTLSSPNSLDYAISSSFQRSLNFEALLNDVARVSQSAKGLQFAEDLTLTIFEKTTNSSI